MKCLLPIFVLLSVQAWSQSDVYILFKPAPETKRQEQSATLDKYLTQYTVLQADRNTWLKLRKERPASFKLTFPFGNGLTVELTRSSPMSPDFILTASNKNGGIDTLEYDPGLHYSGKIAGAAHSLVAISIFADQVTGVISDESCNINLGRIKTPTARETDLYVMYRDVDLKQQPEFDCGLQNEEPVDKLNFPAAAKANEADIQVCSVEIYLDCDFNLFTAMGNSIIETANLAMANFNVVQTIYAAESIPILASEIHVWTTDDPFPNINREIQLDALNAFYTINSLHGDLACLLVPEGWGIAWLDGLCNKSLSNNVSGWMDTPNPFPVYSPSSLAMAHELGHNFGSPHTHSCVWPGGPIDNCAPVEDGICNPGPPPVNGGTIMSYCQLIAPFSLANGFGPLPGNLIRNNYQNAGCLNPAPPFTFTVYPNSVIFNGYSGHVSSYLWDFGDGQTSTESNPTHSYSAPGNYQVCLTTSGSCGTHTNCKNVDLTEDYCWHWQNPLPLGNNLNAVTFINSQTGWAVGDAGTILKTGDGGLSWHPQVPGTIEQLNSLDFSDLQTGWAVGANGKILKTDNGGSTWKLQPSGTTEALFGVCFINSQLGWTVGNHGVILKTTDGGSTWVNQAFSTINQLNQVFFIDAQTGWVAGNAGMILKTIDGGATWLPQISGTANALNSIYFVDAQAGWATGTGGKILKTSNGGANWQVQTYGSANWFHDVHFSDAQTGWAVGGSGKIIKTIDGGATWQFQSSPTPLALFGVHFTDAQIGWAVGYNGNILKSVNGGASWQLQSSGSIEGLYGVYFANNQTGWAVGIGGKILKTGNGGASWQVLPSGISNWLNAVDFVNVQTGWAVGVNGRIVKTGNGGSSWQTQNSGETSTLKAVHFIDDQRGWVVGSDSTILKTVNGGASWQAQTAPGAYSLNTVFFVDNQTGWAAGEHGAIIKTGNGGSTWQSLISGTSRTLNSLYFSDLQTGWAVGDSGTVLQTVDGGLTWKTQAVPLLQALNSVHFLDGQTGWVVGNGGAILKTVDGGLNWQWQTFPSTLALNAVYFTDGQNGWAVGSGGAILKFEIVQKPVTQDVELCKGATAAALMATGINLLWYPSLTGGSGTPVAPVPSTAQVDTMTYFVSQSPVGIGRCSESERTALTVRVVAPDLTVSSTNTCSNTGAASANASGSYPPFSFIWNNGQTGASIHSLMPGDYIVTVTDAHGCTEVKTATVGNGPTPIVNIDTILPPCPSQSNGSATVSVTGGVPPYSAQWSNGETGTTAYQLAAGAYIVSTTDANGCATTLSVMIGAAPAPVSQISAVYPCIGQADGSITAITSGGAGPYSFQWSSGQNTPVAPGLAAGVYTVTVTGGNGCTSTGSVELPAIPVFEVALQVGREVGSASCQAVANPASGIPPYTFQWSDGQTGQMVNEVPGGQISVTVTDASGCTSVQTGSCMTVNTSALLNLEQFSADPNPASTSILVRIQLSGAENMLLRLMDPLGHKLLERHFWGMEMTENIDLAGMPDGCLVVQLCTPSGSVSKIISVVK